MTVLCSAVSLAQQTEDIISEQDSVDTERISLFTQFSCAVKNSNKVELFWKINNTSDGDYFIVERSADGMHYETVSALKIEDTTTGYRLIDNPLNNGAGFYRIKYIAKSGQAGYSKIIQVNLSADVDFKFYPNPVDKLLIIRTSHIIEIQVLDPAGVLKLSKQLQPGLQIINISSLERGSYILNVADKENNRVISAQLLKN